MIPVRYKHRWFRQGSAIVEARVRAQPCTCMHTPLGNGNWAFVQSSQMVALSGTAMTYLEASDAVTGRAQRVPPSETSIQALIAHQRADLP